jgi:hypothetical protein
MSDALEAELAKGEHADRLVLRTVLERYRSSERGLEHVAFCGRSPGAAGVARSIAAAGRHVSWQQQHARFRAFLFRRPTRMCVRLAANWTGPSQGWTVCWPAGTPRLEPIGKTTWIGSW